jgi:tetratricopeptide (TPR) repeat protein
VCEDAERYGMDETFIAKYKSASILKTDSASEENEPVFSKESAAETLEKIMEDNPDDLMVMIVLADYYEEVEKYQDAINLYTKLIELEEHTYYYNSRGLVYSYLDQNELARNDFLKAIELNPESVYPYYNLGLNLYYEDNLEGAVKYLADARGIDPNYTPPYTILIRSYSEMGDIEKAVAIANEGFERFTGEDYVEFLKKLKEEKFQAYHQVSDYKTALTMESELLDEDGNIDNPMVLSNLAYCHYALSEDDKAEPLYKKAIQLAPDDGLVMGKYGLFLVYGRKDAAAAIEVYKKAIELRPLVKSYIHLAQSYEMAGDKKNTKKTYKAAIEIQKKELATSPPRPCAYYYIGECYFGLKDYKKAKEFLLKAVNDAPDYISCCTHFCYEATFTLAKICKIEGNLQEAAKYYKQTIEVSQDREYIEAKSEFDI